MGLGDSRILKVIVRGESSSATTTFKKVGQNADTARRKLHGAGEEGRKTGEKFHKAGGHVTGWSKSMAGGLLASAGLAIGLRGLAEGLKSSVDAARDETETFNKVKVIMGGATDAVMKWSEGSADKLGQSRQQALEAAASFGIFGKQAGLTGQPLANFSTGLVQVATDLASINNTSPEDALDALRSGLAGQVRPLRRYGILLNDTSIKAEAMSMGLLKGGKATTAVKAAQASAISAQINYNKAVKAHGKNSDEAKAAAARLAAAQGRLKDATSGLTGKLTPQQKVLATQSLIMKQAKYAAGDFSRTSGELANKQRILKAKIEDLKAKIGQHLYPVVLKMTTFISDKVVPAIGNFVDGLTKTGKASDGWTQAGRKVHDMLAIIVNVIGAVVGWMRQHQDVAKGLGIALLAVYAALKIYNIGVMVANASIRVARVATYGWRAAVFAVRAAWVLFNALKLVTMIGGYIVKMVAVRVATLAWTASQWLLNTALFANPIGLVILAIAGLIAIIAAIVVGIIMLVKHWRGAWTGIKIAFNAVWGFLRGAFNGLIGLIRRIPSALVFLAVHWRQVWNGIKGVALVIVHFFTGTVKNFFVHTVPSWFAALRNWVVYFFNSIVHHAHVWWSKVANFFTGTVKGFFTRTIPGWVGSLKNTILRIWDSVLGWTKDKWNKIKNFFTGNVKDFFVKTIPGWAKSMRDKFLGWIDSVKFWIKDKFQKVKDWFNNNILKFFKETIPGWAKGLRDGVLNWMDSLKNWIFDKWRKIYNIIRDVCQTIIDQILNGGIIKAFKKLGGIVPNLIAKGVLGGDGNIDIQLKRWTATGLKAQGGPITGPGTSTSDSIPTMLSNGEYVINAAMTRKYLPLIEAINQGEVSHYAGGGAVGAIQAFQRAVGPSLRTTSTTGGNHVKGSYHYRGMAVDFAGTRRAMDIAASNLMKFSGYILELIHSPNWFVKKGHPVGRSTYASVYNGHFNHVHLAMTKAAAEAALQAKKTGKIRGFLGFGPGGAALDPRLLRLHREGAMKFFGPTYAKLSLIPAGFYRELAKYPINMSVKYVNQAVQEAINTQNQMGATNLGRLSGQIGSWIGSASAHANIPASWVRGIRYIMSRESGGNPNARNSIVVMGQHASGLMQMLPSTFRANHAPGTSWNVFDPVANIASSANYIHRRWGSPYNTPWYHGGHWYDKGGMWDGGPGYNATGKPEAVLDPQETQNYKALFSGKGPGNEYHFHFYGPVTGNERQWVRKVMPVIRDEVDKASKRQGKPYFSS